MQCCASEHLADLFVWGGSIFAGSASTVLRVGGLALVFGRLDVAVPLIVPTVSLFISALAAPPDPTNALASLNDLQN